jgi:uncharacterized membrane protein
MGIGASILLIAVGAILAWAVEVGSSSVGSLAIDWVTVGYILMIVGIIGLLWSAMLMNRWRDSRVERDVVVDDRRRVID